MDLDKICGLDCEKEKKDENETLFSVVFVMPSLFLRFYSFKKKKKKFHQNNQQVKRNKTRKNERLASDG